MKPKTVGWQFCKESVESGDISLALTPDGQMKIEAGDEGALIKRAESVIMLEPRQSHKLPLSGRAEISAGKTEIVVEGYNIFWRRRDV